MLKNLYTPGGEHLPDIPWNDYPRPQMVRRDWLCLNGAWEFSVRGKPDKRTIRVPFCPESLLSGIHETYPEGAHLTYERSFTIPENWKGSRILLHLGAADQFADVVVNGSHVPQQPEPPALGGYLPRTYDITDTLLPDDNRLTVLVTDELDHDLPWGKQKNDRGGMWYTPVSGLWQTVWMEPVPENYIRGLTITADTSCVEIEADGADSGVVLVEGRVIPFSDGVCRFFVEKPELWSPENPRLYRFTLCAGEDEVESYFALRSLTVREVYGKKRLCLNGEPFFFHGLLDQGYWSDGIYTPARPDGFENDIRAAKALGFNTLRKHIKIEPERFYYDCDRLGMVVFQDMVNNGDYRFLRDSALPTVGLQAPHRPDGTTARARTIFRRHMEAEVRLLRNHPCICMWTIFNEGWGQFDADALYDELRALDSTRFIDTASGWFRPEKTDVESRHIYFGPLRMGKRPLPQILSEYGGAVYRVRGHIANPKNTWGYRLCTSREHLNEELAFLLEEKLLPMVGDGLCAAVYTQLSDVEDECNGLLTCDRRLCKADPDWMLSMAEQLQRAVRQ